MASETLLEIIKRGVEAWNRWQTYDNPHTVADLSGADLAGVNLYGADLAGANLNDAHLSQADLRDADLTEADLRRADILGANLERSRLRDADLRGADLRETNIGDADLAGANLANADLRSASLVRAHLVGAHLVEAALENADLGESIIGSTIFADIDLSTVSRLETITHRFPSSIGEDTLELSRGVIPEVFLRGCGLSDWQIEAAKLYQPDLTNQELGDILYRVHDLRAQRLIQISPLFISYSHADVAFVDHLDRYLVEAGIRFWRDIHHATAGRLERQVDRAIRLNPTVLIILSENAVGSDWVEHEVRLARRLEKETGRAVLCPIAIDESWKECLWPERLREQVMEYYILDFSDWRRRDSFDRMYRRLLEGLDLYYRK